MFCPILFYFCMIYITLQGFQYVLRAMLYRHNMLYLFPMQVGNTGLFDYYEEMSNDTAQIKFMSISLSSIAEFILHVCSV